MLVVPDSVDDGDELRLDAALGQRQIHRRKHLGGSGLDGSVRADDSADQRSVYGRGRAFAAHIADDDAEPRHGIRDEVVEIAANRSRGDEFRRNVEVRKFWPRLWEQTALQLACKCQIALQPAFLALDFFV